MSINTDIWGASETWRNDTYLNNADILIPASDRDTFRENYQAGRIEYNTIDLSIAFWGISKNAYFAQPKYIACYTDNGVTGTVIEKVHDPVDMPLMLSTSNMGGYTAPKNYENRYKPNVATISGSYNYTSYMAMSFNYQKVMIIPNIVYTNPTNDSFGEGTFENYINTYMSQGYSRIIGLGYRMYRGIPETNVQRSSNFLYGLAPVFNHDVDNYNLRYNDKIFYARGGYSQLLRGVTAYVGNATYLTPIMSEINTEQKNNTVDITTAMAYKYCVSENLNPDERWYFFDDDPLWQINGDSANGQSWRPYPYIECTSENLDTVKAYIFKQLAYLGFPFCLTESEALNKKIGDTGVYLPVFDENGITTGDYKEGADALVLPNAEWDDARTGSGYDPNKTPESDLDNVTGRNLNYWASSKYYLMTQDDLNKFLHIVNGLYTGGTTPEEKVEEVQNMQVDFKGSNPSDYIVALYGLPFQWVWPRTSFQPVMLGPVEILHNDALSDTAVMQINPDSDCTLLFGEISVPALGNFLDYAPYTKMMLYVPFVGTIDIDPVDYAGQTMRVEGTLDKQTGELAIRVMRNGATVTNTLTANLYIQIPITAQAMGNYENNLHQLQMAGFNRALGNLTGAVTGGVSMGTAAAASSEGGGGGTGGLSPTAPISMAANLISLPITMYDYDYRITHCQPSVFYSSSASSANQAKFYRKCKLFIKRPVFLSGYTSDEERSVYAHTVGHACNIIGTITSSGISGYCQIGSIDLSGIPATVEEINAIKQALNKGVYV